MGRLLSVEDLHTSFFTPDGVVKAVRGVNLHLDEGETVGIVGESGSGKSVTALSILRLLPPAGRIVKGEILFEGRNLTAADTTSMRQVRGGRAAMVFQDPMSSLNPLITVGKQVEEMIQIHEKISEKAVKKRVVALFEKVRIPDPAKRYRSYPHEFSGGMRQRVMIAMALACRPSLLIADEPTTALDVTIQDQILKLLKSLQKDLGMSVAFISHDLGVIAEVCSRIIVMYAGMVMEEAPIEEVFNRPAHPYTLGLLDSIPGIEQDRSARLRPILGSPPDMASPPSGCPFHPRCPYARNICAQQTPPFVRLAPGHGTRCWLQTEEAPLEGNPFASKRGVHG